MVIAELKKTLNSGISGLQEEIWNENREFNSLLSLSLVVFITGVALHSDSIWWLLVLYSLQTIRTPLLLWLHVIPETPCSVSSREGSTSLIFQKVLYVLNSKSHGKANWLAFKTQPFEQNTLHAHCKLWTDKTPPLQGVSPVEYTMQQQKREPSQRNDLIEEN